MRSRPGVRPLRGHEQTAELPPGRQGQRAGAAGHAQAATVVGKPEHQHLRGVQGADDTTDDGIGGRPVPWQVGHHRDRRPQVGVRSGHLPDHGRARGADRCGGPVVVLARHRPSKTLSAASDAGRHCRAAAGVRHRSGSGRRPAAPPRGVAGYPAHIEQVHGRDGGPLGGGHDGAAGLRIMIRTGRSGLGRGQVRRPGGALVCACVSARTGRPAPRSRPGPPRGSPPAEPSTPEPLVTTPCSRACARGRLRSRCRGRALGR